jgi:hypothetical protein
MANVFDGIDDQLRGWIARQRRFFVGAETIAHIRENGRVVVMLRAFEGPPRILRLHGRGEVVPAGDERFAALAERCGFVKDQREKNAESIDGLPALER